MAVMRSVVLALSSLLLVSASHPDRPAFDFKGFVAGEQIDPERIKKCDGIAPVKRCFKFRDKMVGVDAATAVSFHEGRMTSAWAQIPRGAFSTVVAAVTEKYGKPCRSGTSVWKNAIGAEIDNVELVWCFRTGELTVQEYGSELKYMFFGYLDEHQAPKPEAKIDF
jgi:hypothetical protein